MAHAEPVIITKKVLRSLCHKDRASLQPSKSQSKTNLQVKLSLLEHAPVITVSRNVKPETRESSQGGSVLYKLQGDRVGESVLYTTAGSVPVNLSR